VLVATGQHGDFVREALEPFDLKPDLALTLERSSSDLVELNTALQRSLGTVLDSEQHDAVLVQGDTATTLAAALVSYWKHIPLVHLEAGLRTGDLLAPWPEEGNRRLVTGLATLHLAPTADAAQNLLNEGVEPARVRVVGNTAVDAVLHTAQRSASYDLPVLSGFPRYVLVTCHRRESWGEGIRGIGRAVSRLATANPDTAFLVATHMNPTVAADMRRVLDGRSNTSLLPPLPYGVFVGLLAGADFVLSDSGGVQEEAPALNVPALVLRSVTERPEAVDAGCARLVGTEEGRIVHEAQRLLDDAEMRQAMAQAPAPYGIGDAAEKCADAMTEFFGAELSPTSLWGLPEDRFHVRQAGFQDTRRR